MFTLSNSLSFIRAPLALLFLQENTSLRVFAVILAMITDSIDGYVARKSKSTSKFGAILDPTMDKFFVYFVLGVLSYEGNVKIWQIMAMISRDIFLALFGIFLWVSKKWNTYEFRAIRWGKASTALQFIILTGITLGYTFSATIFSLFIVMGLLAFLELFQNMSVPRRL